MQSTILECQFCGNDEDPEQVEFDPRREGFWCSMCDGYTYLDPNADRHRFTLLLEDSQQANAPAPAIGLSFKKQLSPLRYPGGKSKFIPFVYAKLQSNQCRRLLSPFAGGASVELALLHAGVVEELVLNDLDVGIYSLFWTIKHSPDDLIHRIMHFKPNHAEFFKAQSIVKLDYAGCTVLDAAWYTLLVNRLAYSGIYRANPLGGRRGNKKDLTVRWNPAELCKRIRIIHEISDRITVLNIDAYELIEEEYWSPSTTIFIDPPYVQKGKQLYRCYYDEEQHLQLNGLLDSLHMGMPGADIILCYDNDPFIERIYWYPTIEKVSRVYSV